MPWCVVDEAAVDVVAEGGPDVEVVEVEVVVGGRVVR